MLAAIAAELVFVNMPLLLVRRLRQISDNLIPFQRALEDAATVMARSYRRDEISVVQRRLRIMLQCVRAAFSSSRHCRQHAFHGRSYHPDLLGDTDHRPSLQLDPEVPTPKPTKTLPNGITSGMQFPFRQVRLRARVNTR